MARAPGSEQGPGGLGAGVGAPGQPGQWFTTRGASWHTVKHEPGGHFIRMLDMVHDGRHGALVLPAQLTTELTTTN